MWFRRLVITVAVIVALWAAGLVWFAGRLPHGERPGGEADAIVALTGGSQRLAVAVGLLDQGRGERLLITGVDRITDSAALARVLALSPAGKRALARNPDLFACCIDLGYEAQSTIGNAHEAKAWAKDHGYRSLLIVTSVYHVPRSRIEFGQVIADRDLIFYPVEPSEVNLDGWWYRPASIGVLALEFNKYLLTLVRVRLFAV